MAVSNLSTLITFNPWAVGPSVPVEEIADHFQTLHIRHVPVVDDQRRVVGMISESDLLRLWQRREQAAGEAACGGWDATLAREIMTRDVVTITPQVSFQEALGLLRKRPIHALIVVENDQLLGVVSSRDFLREFSYGQLPGGRQTLQELLGGRPVEWLEADTPLGEALLTMQRQGAAALPVVKGGCPLGVVTQRAIVRARRDGGRSAPAPAQDAAASHAGGAVVGQIAEASPVLRPGQRLCEAAAAMIEHHTSTVVVVSASHRLVGMVTEVDLLQVLYDALA